MSTKNNWFIPEIKNNKFKIILEPYKFNSISFLKACQLQAIELASTYDNLYIAYSGGLDSELVLKVFNDLNLKITPILVETPYNIAETKWSKEYCKDNNLNLEVINLSGKDFIDLLVEKNQNLLLSGLPIIIVDFIKEKNGRLITGCGDPFNDKSKIYSDLKFTEWDYYLDGYDSSHPSAFFNYSLEVFYSLIKEIDYSLNLQEAKAKLYNLKIRPKMYWHEDFYEYQRNYLKNKTINMFYKKNKDLIKLLEEYII